MRQCIALDDSDRWPWLSTINQKAQTLATKGTGVVIACSALKEVYREWLSKGIRGNQLFWVVLEGDYDTIFQRMQNRKEHYMPADMLHSQLASWESPDYGLHIDIAQPIDIILSHILNEMKSEKSEFGLIGLGVMGKSLARNLADKGFRLSLYNRHVPDIEENVASDFISTFKELSDASGFDEIKSFVSSLSSPRKIMLMVNAGPVVDAVITELLQYLDPGDIIIDGGNSHYQDTQRRTQYLESKGIHYIGTGVSGGEEGALKGPSIMPGGSHKAYPKVALYLETIAAKDVCGQTCCTYIGEGGAGHFVKMVHNGIEYAEMQLLAEVYSMMRTGSDLEPYDISEVMRTWCMTDLDSYLLEITVDILKKKENGAYIIDSILDQAGNKGTGSWTTIAAAELGVPITMITSALFARYMSSFKKERVVAANVYDSNFKENSNDFPSEKLMNAYRVARLVNHHQGIHLMDEADAAYSWKLNLPEIARIWTNGCIIRSKLMIQLIDVLKTEKRILIHPDISPIVRSLRKDLDETVAYAHLNRINVPCLSAACDFINAYTEARSNANIIQAQRDYFGAHTYKKLNDPTGRSYHTDWKMDVS